VSLVGTKDFGQRVTPVNIFSLQQQPTLCNFNEMKGRKEPKAKDATADGFAYLTKRVLKRAARTAGKEAAERAMETMGYVVIAEKGNIVKKWKDGNKEVIGQY
jgi:hypothetical protein